ncbi:hypothetical protein C8R46DRAFT_1038272 [Mycena filopes]|nr:hypothetical protein C8R46DRAFT_1038272 [Mycena filopes]
MPAVLIPSTHNDTCFTCDGIGSIALRRCSKCQVAIYCSSACQRADWPSHKQHCLDREELFSEFDGPTITNEIKPFLKWLSHWRSSLVRWAAFGADLAHKPLDYLEHHTFVLHLDRKEDANDVGLRSMFTLVLKSDSTQAVQGGMCRDRELIATILSLPDESRKRQLLSDFRFATPGSDVVRLLVIAGTCYNASSDRLSEVFPGGTHGMFSTPSDTQSRSLSTAMKLAFLDEFCDAVESGRHCILTLVSTEDQACKRKFVTELDQIMQ